MFCKNCGKPIPDNSPFCTECGAPQNITQVHQANQTTQVHVHVKKKRSGCLIALAVVVILIGSIAIINGLGGKGDSNNGASQPPASAANDSKMTADEFAAIETGMTYEQVVEIVGDEGELMSESDIGAGSEYVMQIYTWAGNGGLGSNANVTFQGGKVMAKAQLGLE